MAADPIKNQLREVKAKSTALREQIRANKKALEDLKAERDRLKAELGNAATPPAETADS